MATIKLYFCKIHDGGEVEISVHRDLETLIEEWNRADKNEIVGLIHVSFIRPSMETIPLLAEYKGKVLTTPSAEWSLPSQYESSQNKIGQLSISGEITPLKMIVKGLGYIVNEPECIRSVIETVFEDKNSKYSIVSAAQEILNESSGPLSAEEVYAFIAEKGLYYFSVKQPVTALLRELNLHTVGGGANESDALFGTTKDDKIFSLTNRPRNLVGWVGILDEKEPELYSHISSYGVNDDSSYLENANKLDRNIRDKIDLFRYEKLFDRIHTRNPEQLLHILPETICRVRIENLNLPIRVFNVLNKSSITCLTDLKGVPVSEMMTWPNFGRKSVKDLCLSLTSNLDNLLEQCSIKNIDFGAPVAGNELNADIGDLGIHQNKDDLITKILAIPLKVHFESALKRLSERDRNIIEYRTGYIDGKPLTLQEVGDLIGVTRERVRQIQKKYIQKIIETEFWDDCIEININQLLVGRNGPLYLEMLEIEDPWFVGFMENYTNLKEIIKLFSGNEICVIQVDGATIISRINQEDWDLCVSQCRKSLIDKSKRGLWTRQDVDLLFNSTLSAKDANELLPLLQEQYQEFLQFSGSEMTATLVSYGRSVEPIIRVILAQANEPLHYSEITARVTEALKKEVNERNIQNALITMQEAKLFGRGIYGLDSHNPISQSMSQNIMLVASSMINEGPLRKQWHCSEILEQIKNRIPRLPGELDSYILSIILSDAKGLVYLNRMVWARSDSEQSADDRIDLGDAFTKIVEEHGGPIGNSEIKKILGDMRGVSHLAQIHPTERMIQVGPGLWGLVDRDIIGTSEGNGKRLGVLFEYLLRSQKGIHVSEVDEILSGYGIDGDSPDAYTLLNLAQRDDRFHLTSTMYLSLTKWGDVRRINLTQAIRLALESIVTPLRLAELHVKIEQLTELPIDTSITSQILKEGGVYDRVLKVWKKA